MGREKNRSNKVYDKSRIFSEKFLFIFRKIIYFFRIPLQHRINPKSRNQDSHPVPTKFQSCNVLKKFTILLL